MKGLITKVGDTVLRIYASRVNKRLDNFCRQRDESINLLRDVYAQFEQSKSTLDSSKIGPELQKEIEEAEAMKAAIEYQRVELEREFADLRAQLNKYKKVEMPPLRWLISVGSFCLGKKLMQRYVEPAIADMHEEYFSALKAGDKWQARMAKLRFTYLIIYPLVRALMSRLSTLVELVDKFRT